MILYTGGGGGRDRGPFCISERSLCWLIRHLKQRKHTRIKSEPLQPNLFSVKSGVANLVTRWSVRLLSKAQADERKRHRGQQGHWGKEGDGMRWSCYNIKADKQELDSWLRGIGAKCSRIEEEAIRYLIWASRRTTARTCRGWEPRWPGWWLLCGFAGWVWWGRMHSRCCICQPRASGSRRADLQEKETKHAHCQQDSSPPDEFVKLSMTGTTTHVRLNY